MKHATANRVRIWGSFALLTGILIFFHRAILSSLFSFLCLNRPIAAPVLIVESWLFDYMLKEAAAEFNHGGYELCLVAGSISVGDSLYHSPPEQTLLERYGVPLDKIQVVHIPQNAHHHTARSARAVARWLRANRPQTREIMIFTGGPHARKSWIIYRRILGPDYHVGVRASSIQHFDAQHWWLSPRGLWVTTRYLAGYLYALCWPFRVAP